MPVLPDLNLNLCAGAFIVRYDQFLFGKRAAHDAWYAGVWDIFGGHIEQNELPQDALSRELKEELGIVPTAFELFTTVEEPGKLRYYIYFVTSWTGGEPVNCSQEHSEITWFFRHQLDTISLASARYLQVVDAWLKSDTQH